MFAVAEEIGKLEGLFDLLVGNNALSFVSVTLEDLDGHIVFSPCDPKNSALG